MRYYIMQETKHAGELQEGLVLDSKYQPLWFDNKEDFLNKCKQLNIDYDDTMVD